MPSMEKMKEDHLRYGHHGQGVAIAAELRQKFPALEIVGPEDAESGRYVAVYVTLVPGLVRMRMHLTSSGLNQHSYNLQPITESVADQRRFVEFMTDHHRSIPLKKGGHYAKLPGWDRANVKNDSHSTIAKHVQGALKILALHAQIEPAQ